MSVSVLESARARPTLGMDPEMFLVDAKGKVVPADCALPPQYDAVVVERTHGLGLCPNAVYRDGVQAEMQIDPHVRRRAIIDNVCFASKRLRELAIESGFRLLCEPSVPITRKTLKRATDPTSVMFGCSPELLARTDGKMHHVDLDASKHLVRYSGGHIHVGCGEEDGPVNQMLLSAGGKLEGVRCADVLLGTIHVLIQRPADVSRRLVYGLAGSYRETNHGFEYRPPSNLVIRHPLVTDLFLSLMRMAVAMGAYGLRKEFFNVPEDEVVHMIDTGDRAQAYRVFCAMKPHLMTLAKAGEEDLSTKDGMAALEFLMITGFDAVFPDEFDQNWRLEEDYEPNGDLTDHWDVAAPQLMAAQFGDAWEAFRVEYNPATQYL